MIRAVALALVLCGLTQAAQAVTCRPLAHDGTPYTICKVDAATEDLRLFLYDDTGVPLGHFNTIDRALGAQGQMLGFAMNAGMYHDDRAPVGLYIQDGEEVRGVVARAGPGNFGLLPNGVLCLRPGRADVIETRRYVSQAPDCRDATQSGPMLVIGGKLHPKFLADSTSRYVRNGVGSSKDGRRVVFAISDVPVTFHEFGRLFRDGLGLPNALYLDGNVSRLHAPDLGRSDVGFWLGPIVGVVEPAE